MKNVTLRKTITALMLVMTLLVGNLAAIAESASVVADLQEVEENEQPLLLASVNGDEIWTNNEDMQKIVESNINYYAANGQDISDDPTLYAYALESTIREILLEQKRKEHNIGDISDEDVSAIQKEAQDTWELNIQYFSEALGNLTEDSTESEIAAARLDALNYIETYFGYTEESYLQSYVDESIADYYENKLIEALITEDDVTARFNEIVEEDKETYEDNVSMYEFYTQYYGAVSYYMPKGYRGVSHILLDVDEDLLDNYKALMAKLEEQQEAETADETTENVDEAASEANENVEEAAVETTEETEEPVTQEMVDAAKQAILDSVQSTVDEIMAKFEAGTPFADLVAEYGVDPGMKTEPYITEGYTIHKDTLTNYDPAFLEAALELKEVGDISDPILSSFGVHILYYLRDIPAGAVELTDEIKLAVTEELFDDIVSEWEDSAEIVYTYEGQAILDAVNADTESVETTEATEETLADGN